MQICLYLLRILKSIIIGRKMMLQKETDHFKFYCDIKDIACLSDVSFLLEENYGRITANLEYRFTKKIEVELYPDLEEYHKASGVPRAEWAVGNVNFANRLQMVSPLNPGPIHSYNTILQVAIHEFIHFVVRSASNQENLPNWLHIVCYLFTNQKFRWLDEGIAVFDARQMQEDWIKYVTWHVVNDKIPIFYQFDKDPVKFGNSGGYQFSYTVIEFLVEEYGYEKIRQLIRMPNEFSNIFRMSLEDCYQKWVVFLKSKYNSKV